VSWVFIRWILRLVEALVPESRAWSGPGMPRIPPPPFYPHSPGVPASEGPVQVGLRREVGGALYLSASRAMGLSHSPGSGGAPGPPRTDRDAPLRGIPGSSSSPSPLPASAPGEWEVQPTGDLVRSRGARTLPRPVASPRHRSLPRSLRLRGHRLPRPDPVLRIPLRPCHPDPVQDHRQLPRHRCHRLLPAFPLHQCQAPSP